MAVKVAAVQIALGKKSYDEAVDDSRKLIKEAAEAGAQIVCLPEHWLAEHKQQAGGVADRIAAVAKNEQVFVITGANYIQTDRGVRIRSTPSLTRTDT